MIPLFFVFNFSFLPTATGRKESIRRLCFKSFLLVTFRSSGKSFYDNYCNFSFSLFLLLFSPRLFSFCTQTTFPIGIPEEISPERWARILFMAAGVKGSHAPKEETIKFGVVVIVIVLTVVVIFAVLLS